MTSSHALVLLLLPLIFLCACGNESEPIPDAVQETEKEWTAIIPGEAILERTRRICEIGARPPGSEGIAQVRLEIKAQLAEVGIRAADVEDQVFTAKTPMPETDGSLEFVNIIAKIPGKSESGVMLAAHYDSKLLPSIDFVGANDAACAVAALIEIAGHLKKQVDASGETPEFTTWFVFFDGEESIKPGWEDAPSDNTYGSRHLASKLDVYPFTAMILLDMIGTENISLAEDTLNSDAGLVGLFQQLSRETFGHNILHRPTPVVDDHAPFKGKIPAIDLIEGQFEQTTWWHTAEDTIDRLSARSLGKVVTLVLKGLPEVEKRHNR